METRHRIHVGDARDLEGIAGESIELVVTSPPYPMIELWDDLFARLDPEIDERLEAKAGAEAFERMHALLDEVWDEIARVLVPGGIACVNIGDATRRLGDGFRRYANHARVTSAMERRGFEPLPTIHWYKPTNAATKFMGSGMIPPNAYVTQEHEHILLFRKGETLRDFEPGAPRRYEAAFFWEERNRWFSDRWDEVGSRRQELPGGSTRDRAAAFPVEIPYRLINMFSVYEDTVLDPFWGTGTTSMAAMAAGRHSIGIEIDEDLRARFSEAAEEVESLASELARRRLRRHQSFVEEASVELPHRSTVYDVPVKTRQEVDLRLYEIADLSREDATYHVTHAPIDEVVP